MPAVDLRKVAFTWPGQNQPALAIDRLCVEPGERVFVQGRSGSGKTTLLSLIGAILQPQSGTVEVNGTALHKLTGAARDRFRAEQIGIIFQQFNLLPFLSLLENVQLPCRFSRARYQRAIGDASSLDSASTQLLQALQLPVAELAERRVSELSVGQQQRVAVARALIGRPPLIIADEPTSALDSDTRQAFLDLLFAQAANAGSTLIFVSHDRALVSMFDRCVDLHDINRAAGASAGRNL